MVNTGFGHQRYHLPMSETPPSGPSHGQGASGFPPAPASSGYRPGPAAPPWPTAPPIPSRWPTFAALVIALVAVALAIVGWFRPSPPPAPAHPASPTYTEQQTSDAKARVCSALDVVNKGALLHSGTSAPPQQSNDPAMAEAQAADSRLSIIAGGWYLRDHLSPATPQELTTAIQHLSEVALDLGQNYLAGAQNKDPAQADLIKEGNSAFAHALELCK
jgi:hypothetical protein